MPDDAAEPILDAIESRLRDLAHRRQARLLAARDPLELLEPFEAAEKAFAVPGSDSALILADDPDAAHREGAWFARVPLAQAIEGGVQQLLAARNRRAQDDDGDTFPGWRLEFSDFPVLEFLALCDEIEPLTRPVFEQMLTWMKRAKEGETLEPWDIAWLLGSLSAEEGSEAQVVPPAPELPHPPDAPDWRRWISDGHAATIAALATFARGVDSDPADLSPAATAARWGAVWDLRRRVSLALFEILAYEQPEANLHGLWCELQEHYLGYPRHPERLWSATPEIIRSPFSLAASVIGDLAVPQLLEESVDPQTLRREVEARGASATLEKLLDERSGRPLDPEAWCRRHGIDVS